MSVSNEVASEKRARRRWLLLSVGAVVALLIISLFVLQPGMPDRIAIYTGPEESAYFALGQRYAEDLRKQGLEVDVVPTQGLEEGIERLTEERHAVAFAPSTLNPDGDHAIELEHVTALGSVALEPLWLFCRTDLADERFSSLAGYTLGTAGDGTVSEHVGQRLVSLNGLDDQVEWKSFPEAHPDEVVAELQAKNVDAVLVTGDTEAPIVEAMLNADGVTSLSFHRVEAYAGRIPGISSVTVPEGIYDLARNVPSRDTHLLAATTCLVTGEHLHPAVVAMLLVAAGNHRSTAADLTTRITLPSSDNISLPLNTAARRYYDRGETGLSQFVPYPVARSLRHIGFIVIPLLGGLFLLFRIVPTAIQIWATIQLQSMFKQLEAVEKAHHAGADHKELLETLRIVDEKSAKMFVPRPKLAEYIDFRQFLHDMRDRVETGIG